MVEMAIFNVQRKITPKVGKPELLFMCSAYRLIVLYICVKFGENISNGFRDIEQTQMMEALMDRHSKFFRIVQHNTLIIIIYNKNTHTKIKHTRKTFSTVTVSISSAY